MRRLTVFCKVVTFWAVMRFSENFTLSAPKCRSNDNRLCDRILQIGHHLRHNGAKGQFHGESSKVSF